MMALLRKIPKWVWFFVFVLAVPVVAWNLAYPTHSFRYKVTVNVETPEGLKSGYAVREFIIMQQPITSPHETLRGEAVVVDLGHRGVLFAVIGSDDEYVVFKTFPSERGGLTRAGARYYERLKAKAALAPLYYPLLVTFTDINDPKTVTVAYQTITGVDHEKSGMQFKANGVEDRMADLFGEGVRLQSIVVEMTRESVTVGVIDKHISKAFWDKYGDWVKSTKISQREFTRLFSFKAGVKNGD